MKNSKLINTLKKGNIVIPLYLIQNYKKLNINLEEFIFLIYLYNIGDKCLFDPNKFAEDLALDTKEVMNYINVLSDKGLITVKTLKTDKDLIEEHILLDNFYDKEAPQIREKERMGIIIDNVPFDVSLTKEEAVMKYCGCDMKTAQKAFDLVKKVNTAAEFHTGKIREAYTGNLFEQLGRENERPIFDERVRKMQETIITSSSDIEERLGDFAKKIGIYYDSIHEIGPNQTEANADGKKQGSK